MADLKNPFTPGTGAMLPYFAGRCSLLQKVMTEAKPLYRSEQGEQRAPNRDIILYGPEGIGKTVLLRQIEEKLDKPEEPQKSSKKPNKELTILHWTPATELHTRKNATNAILPKGPWNIFIKGLRQTNTISVFGVRFDFDGPPPQTLHYRFSR